MNRIVVATLPAFAAMCCIGQPVVAQSSRTAQSAPPVRALLGDDALTQTPTEPAPPAPRAVPSGPAAPAAPPSVSAATASTGILAPASPSQNVAAPAQALTSNGLAVAYVRRTKPPVLIDTTVAKVEFGLIGSLASISSGHDIVADDDIEDPSGDMARDIASAYAAAHGAEVATTPILVDQLPRDARTQDLSTLSGGARYVVDVIPTGMNLIYFPLDWTHFDLMFGATVRIIDTSNNTVIGHTYCLIKPTKTPEVMTHSQLLANHAAELKLLIVRKSQTCVSKMKADLSI